MTPSLRIQKANIEEAAYIALLGRVTFSETFGHLFRDRNDLIDYCERTYAVQKIRAGINKKDNVFWIAYVDDLPVAYAKLKLDSPSEFLNTHKLCQLQKIYVLKHFIAMKIGHRLQATLLEEARERSFEMIWLSVLDSNKRAIAFYKKNGFREIGTHAFQIGKESFNFLAMAKKL